MARQLLPAGTGAGVTGIWVRVEGGFKRSVPMRISAIGSFAVDVITIEELIGGTPGNGTNSPYPPQTDSGTAKVVGTIPVAGADLLVEDPIQFVRARTGANMTGTVDYCGAEMLE